MRLQTVVIPASPRGGPQRALGWLTTTATPAVWIPRRIVLAAEEIQDAPPAIRGTAWLHSEAKWIARRGIYGAVEEAPEALPLVRAKAWLTSSAFVAGFWSPRRGIYGGYEDVELGALPALLHNLGWLLLQPIQSPSQRGNIDYDQLRAHSRHGLGDKVQMLAQGASTTLGDAALFDAGGNLVDAGGPPAVLVPTPAHAGSTGKPGQYSTDPSGNIYFCYARNAWAQIGPGGYSNSF